ncbi:Early nodulin-12A [Phytophthora citrophthora]|uniref:Early nodulin-12A n=1 Tax=Phytophthora citrophthora TaxID=4793 RepID=A0AAD9G3S3_9STRA|nr:Early nodulin-12A [Phytophthora citrophthora]
MQLLHRYEIIVLILLAIASLPGITQGQSLTYVANYEDAACTWTPTQFVFTSVANATCASTGAPRCSAVSGSSIRRYEACSTPSQYTDVLKTAFRSKLYLVAKTYSDPGKCEVLDQVTAYVADNLCHVAVDGASSFRVTTIIESGFAVLTTYNGKTCSGAGQDEELNYSNLTTTTCTDGGDQLFSMGGATNKWSVMSVFSDSECALNPINLQVYHRFICDAERNPASAECGVLINTLYSTWSCAEDYVAFIENALGDGVPFLVEEWFYDVPNCTQLEHLMVYPADGSCISMDWPSYKVHLHHNGTVTFDTFGSSNCTGDPETQSFDRARLTANTCVADSTTKYSIGGVTPQWRAIAIYESDACSTDPVQLTYTMDFICEPRTSRGDSGCVIGQQVMTSSVSDCTDDYFAFTAGEYEEDHPHVLVENYVGDGECSELESASVYSADGLCHDSSDGLTSFSVTFEPDLSITMEIYEGANCNGTNSSQQVTRDLLESHECFEGDKKFYTGGINIELPTTEPPTTEPPTTEPPTTEPPTTEPPTTEPPTTEPPTTETPTTEAPTLPPTESPSLPTETPAPTEVNEVATDAPTTDPAAPVSPVTGVTTGAPTTEPSVTVPPTESPTEQPTVVSSSSKISQPATSLLVLWMLLPAITCHLLDCLA